MMLELPLLVARNLLHHGKKTVPVGILCAFILMMPVASALLVKHIRSLADLSLQALNTELILQNDKGPKDAGGVLTSGLIEPFNLHSFPREVTLKKLGTLNKVSEVATALVLWRLDPKGSLTIVGLDPAEPPVGLRNIESLLMAGGRFFSGAGDEVILERHFARLFGHRPGGTFTLVGIPLRIIGLVDFTQRSNLSNAAVFLPYRTAISLAGLEDPMINQVYLNLASASDTAQVSDDVGRLFPGFSLVTRDSLFKNLSAFNRLIYSGGYFINLLILPTALLLLLWTLKMHSLEFAGQQNVLRTLGWPMRYQRAWRAWDLAFLLAGAAVLTLLLSIALNLWLRTHLNVAPLLDQGFRP